MKKALVSVFYEMLLRPVEVGEIEEAFKRTKSSETARDLSP